MKQIKVIFLVTAMLLNPIASYGDFGLFGREQCGYEQTPFPVNKNDSLTAEQQRMRGLKDYRASLAAQMSKIGDDLLKAQGVLKAYFAPPWCDAMFAHMDNEYDCCTSRATAQNIIDGTRMPAAQGIEGPDAYVEDTVYTNPEDTNQDTPSDDTVYTNPEAGQHCLQTGFGASREWNQYACRDGGQIDPEVCSNSSISKSPANYEKCIGVIKIYRDLTSQKKALATQIADLDAQINSSRPSENAPPKKRGFLSGLGNFLGGVMSVALPFVISQYVSYSAKKQMTAPQPLQGPRHILAPPNASGRPLYGQQQRTGTFGLSQMQPPPPFYGPRYGYGMSNGSQYGQILPGLMQGSFGCSSGMLGGGMNMLSMMMMMSLMSNNGTGSMNPMMMAMLGGGLNMNLNASLNGNFSTLGGGAPLAAMQMAYANNSISPTNMPGSFSPLYQPGGINGATPTYIPNFPSSNISNFYTGQPNSNYTTGLNGCSACVSPFPQATSYANPSGNAFFYAQQMNNNQRLQENQAALMRRQSELDYQLYQLRLLNGQNSNAFGTDYQMGNINGLNSPIYRPTGN